MTIDSRPIAGCAAHELRDGDARRSIFQRQLRERRKTLCGLFVAQAGVEHPSHDEGPSVRHRRDDGVLRREIGHRGMHCEAVRGTAIGQGSDVVRRQQGGRAQLDGVERPARQRGQEGVQALREGRCVSEHSASPGRELKQHDTELRPQAIEHRPDHHVRCAGGVEKVRIRLACARPVALVSGKSFEQQTVPRLHEKTKVVGHGAGVSGEVAGAERCVVRAIDAHRTQQGCRA